MIMTAEKLNLYGVCGHLSYFFLQQISNCKKVPDAFLRRCFFHYIQFPDSETLKAIVDVHFPHLHKSLLDTALALFFELRDVPGLKKKPSTSELLDWLRLLLVEDIDAGTLQTSRANGELLPLAGALLKHEQDIERLTTYARTQRR